jgi:hypothetical protein
LSVKYFDYKAGLGNVGSYQASARPFLSSSIHVSGNLDIVEVSFPTVTRFLTIKNTVSQVEAEVGLKVGISALGVSGSNNLTLYNEESYSADWRLSSVFLQFESTPAVNQALTASVIAGLTNIDSGELNHNWSGSEGVG